MSLNKVILVGNVGKDPEIKNISGDMKVANFSVATSETYKDKNGEKVENTEWHRIVAWRRLAEVIENYVTKGQQLLIEGKIVTRQWEDQAGEKRYTTEIVANSIQMLGKNPNSSGQGSNSNASKPANKPAASKPAGLDQPNESFDNEGGDEDLPF